MATVKKFKAQIVIALAAFAAALIIQRGDWSDLVLLWLPLLGVTFNKFDSFVEAVAEKVHNLGADTLTVFLTTNANAPVASNTQLSNITQISYTNLSSRNITTTSSAQTSGTYKLTLTDLVLTASGAVATFRRVGVYNDTATNDELIGHFDYGSDVTMANGETFTLDFDGSAGFLTIGP